MTRSSTDNDLPPARHPFLRSLRAHTAHCHFLALLIYALAAPARRVAQRTVAAFDPFFIAPAALVLATPSTPRMLTGVPRYFPAVMLVLCVLLRLVLAVPGG